MYHVTTVLKMMANSVSGVLNVISKMAMDFVTKTRLLNSNLSVNR